MTLEEEMLAALKAVEEEMLHRIPGCSMEDCVVCPAINEAIGKVKAALARARAENDSK